MRATYNNNVMVRVKPPGEPAVDTLDTGDAKGADQRHAGDDAEDDGEHCRHRQERVVDLL